MEKYLYSDLAKLEDIHFWHIAKREAVLAFTCRFKKKGNLKILDIGCGTGRNIKEFSQIGEVWGVDISKEAIEFCREKGIKTVKIGRSDKTGFRDNFFDVVTLLDVLEHIDEESTLREVRRILKKDGLMILTVPAFSWLWSQWDVVLHHRRRYSKNSLIKLLIKNQFKIQKISYMYSFLILPALAIRIIKSHFFKKNYGSDFHIYFPFLNRLLLFLARLERKIIFPLQIPFGTSLICISKK